MAADAEPFSLIEQLDPDLVLQVLAQLRAPHHVAIAGAVNKRLRHLSASDILWRELCARRWLNRLEAAVWLERANATAPLDTQHGHWREQFALREHEICAHYPVFLMGGRLQLGVPNGLHLFEPRCCTCPFAQQNSHWNWCWHCCALKAYPDILLRVLCPLLCRYRRLVQTAMGRDRRFVFAVNAPTPGSIAYLCELHRVTVYGDGRADVVALPVSEVQLLSHDYEIISANHPPLLWCFAEILPLPGPVVLAEVADAQRALSYVPQMGGNQGPGAVAGAAAQGGGGGGGNDDDDDDDWDDQE